MSLEIRLKIAHAFLLSRVQAYLARNAFCQQKVHFRGQRKIYHQSEAVKELIEVQVHLFEDCADKSERPDVRTINAEALPAQVLEWLQTMRKHHLGQDLRNLLDEISKHRMDKQVIEERLVAFKQRMNMEALLPACCCCSIRDDYLLEGDLEFIRAKRTRKPREKQQEKDTSLGAFPQGTKNLICLCRLGRNSSHM